MFFGNAIKYVEKHKKDVRRARRRMIFRRGYDEFLKQRERAVLAVRSRY